MLQIEANENEIKDKFKDFFNLLQKTDVILLDGPIGSGKTTLVNNFIKYYDSNVASSSPSYNIFHEYVFPEFKVIHIDLFRIKNEDDLESTGFWDVIQDDNAIFFIEWPEKAAHLIFNKRKVYSIKINLNNESRVYSIHQ